eukprot:gene19163-22574_t
MMKGYGATRSEAEARPTYSVIADPTTRTFDGTDMVASTVFSPPVIRASPVCSPGGQSSAVSPPCLESTGGVGSVDVYHSAVSPPVPFRTWNWQPSQGGGSDGLLLPVQQELGGANENERGLAQESVVVVGNVADRCLVASTVAQKFEDSFHEKCDKYPFVQQYNKLLTNPTGRYITFVMQQPNLRNGGLGDRIAGLSTAVMLSLRFNRTLIIRSGNFLHLYFRPFHPTDIHAQPPQYTWENW